MNPWYLIPLAAMIGIILGDPVMLLYMIAAIPIYGAILYVVNLLIGEKKPKK